MSLLPWTLLTCILAVNTLDISLLHAPPDAVAFSTTHHSSSKTTRLHRNRRHVLPVGDILHRPDPDFPSSISPHYGTVFNSHGAFVHDVKRRRLHLQVPLPVIKDFRTTFRRDFPCSDFVKHIDPSVVNASIHHFDQDWQRIKILRALQEITHPNRSTPTTTFCQKIATAIRLHQEYADSQFEYLQYRLKAIKTKLPNPIYSSSNVSLLRVNHTHLLTSNEEFVSLEQPNVTDCQHDDDQGEASFCQFQQRRKRDVPGRQKRESGTEEDMIVKLKMEQGVEPVRPEQYDKGWRSDVMIGHDIIGPWGLETIERIKKVQFPDIPIEDIVITRNCYNCPLVGGKNNPPCICGKFYRHEEQIFDIRAEVDDVNHVYKVKTDELFKDVDLLAAI